MSIYLSILISRYRAFRKSDFSLIAAGFILLSDVAQCGTLHLQCRCEQLNRSEFAAKRPSPSLQGPRNCRGSPEDSKKEKPSQSARTSQLQGREERVNRRTTGARRGQREKRCRKAASSPARRTRARTASRGDPRARVPAPRRVRGCRSVWCVPVGWTTDS
jgi:hypothetical protein